MGKSYIDYSIPKHCEAPPKKALLLITTLANADVYKNNSNKKIVVKLRSGKTLIIPPKGSAEVSDNDFPPELGFRIVTGDVTMVQTKKPSSKKR